MRIFAINMGKLIKIDGKWVDESLVIHKVLPVFEMKGREMRKDFVGEKPILHLISTIRSHNDIRAVIKLKRKEKNLNQDIIAKDIGMSKEQYSRIESGACVMRIDQMVRICEYLDLAITIL